MQSPTLTGRVIRLEPLEERHRELLRPVAQDTRIWTATLTHAMGAEFDVWFDDALATAAAGARAPFAVMRLSDGAALGSSSYLDIALAHKRVEIGATWYHPDVWGTAVNPDAKLLLLTHAFEQLKCIAVELRTHVLNSQSRRAIERIGAKLDGTLRNHMRMPNGTLRDTVVYSIIESEWPTVRTHLRWELQKGR